MNLFNQFGGAIGVIGLLLSGFVYLYSTAKRGRHDIIRQDNADLRASNQEMRTERAGLEATIVENRENIRQLRDIATQTPAVTKLIEINNRQQQQSAEQHMQVIKALSELAVQMSSLAKAINASYKKKGD